MTTMVRLSFWVSADHRAAFGENYERQLRPILARHGLVESDERGRETAAEVFSRLFEVESPAAIAAKRQSLLWDPAWQEVLSRLGATLGAQKWFERFSAADGTGNDYIPAMVQERQPIPYCLELYYAGAGDGTRVVVGSGFRQGVWHNFGVQDGLGSAQIECILQDRSGHLWFGLLEGGVSRYDGHSFTTFTPKDGLAQNGVAAMLEDREGHLWFATGSWILAEEAGGLSRWDGQRFETFSIADGLAHNYVPCMVQDRQGLLWFGTAKGVSCYDGQRFKSYTTADGLGHNWIQAMAEDHRGHLWFGTHGGGVSRWDGQGFETFSTADGLATNGVLSIAVDGRGHVWIGTFNWLESGQVGGVSRWDGEGFETFTTADGLGHNVVPSIATDRDGHVWIGTYRGVSRFDEKGFATYTTADGLAHNCVINILEDRAGYIWFGTRSGVSRYEGQQIVGFSTADGLATDWLCDLLVDRDGHLWLGTEDNGVIRYDGQTFEHFTTADGLLDNCVRYLERDQQGQLWFRTLKGTCSYDGRGFVPFTTVDGQQVTGFLHDRAGRLWFTIDLGGGVSCWDGRAFKNFTIADGLSDNRVHAMLEDQQGRLWFGTWSNGVSCYDGQRFISFTTADGLSDNRVHSILEDRQGRMWFGTQGGGVNCYDGRVFTTFTTLEKLGGNIVWSMLEDRQGHLWFATLDGGVSRYDGRVFQTLSRKDGLMSDAVRKILESEDGTLWIATEGGLNHYRPQRQPPTVHFTGVVADRQYEPGEEVVLPSSQKLVQFHFQGRSWTTSVERMAYVAKLEGHDGDWQAFYEPSVTYQDLGLGEYTFQVQAVDRDLNYSEPASVTVRVVPDPHLEALTQALNTEGGEFVGTSIALRKLQAQLREAAPSELTVLITGETGTGKGLAARFLHKLSRQKDGPFVHVNCGALPEGLVESELFGHEKGAFTGAHSRKLGKIELAEGGSLFLDEIGDMPLAAQVKLLQLLEERVFERVGGTQSLKAQSRIIAATNRDLSAMVAEGSFRKDLYFRLQVFPVELPPLRQRLEDISLLASYFMERMAAHLNKRIGGLSPGVLMALQGYAWPGNVRELEHTIQRAVIVCSSAAIEVEDIHLESKPAKSEPVREIVPLEEFERKYILEVLERTGWVIKGQRGAAMLLGLHESTLRHRMRKLGIRRKT